MAIMAFLLRAAKWQMVAALAAGLLNGLCSAGLVAFVVAVVFHKEYPADRLILAFTALVLLMVSSRVCSSLLLTRLGQSAIFRLRAELGHKILATPYRRLQALGAPRLLVNLTDDVAAVAESFSWIPLLCINVATVLGCLAYVAWLSPPLFAVMAVVMAFGVLSFRAIQRGAIARFKQARECDDRLFQHFRGLTEGVKELQLNRDKRRAFFADELQATAERGQALYLAGMTAYVLGANWGTGLFYLVIGLFLFVLPQHLPLPADTMAGAVFAVIYMMAPLVTLFNGLPILGRAQAALGKLDGLAGRVDAPSPEADCASAGVPAKQARRLRFAGVTHHYFRDEAVRDFMLGPLDFVLEPGELVFVVGGNGSGKTTLALLLIGLFAPESGTILLDGAPVTAAAREDYRQHFSAVFSDFYLFESLLGFGNRELDEQARDYLRRLQLDHKVRIEDGRFSTVDLSQGQRKRLALLAAYLEDRPFYVFDEWAADQDPAFKQVFYTEILPSLKAKGKTVVVITHDDAYFHLADRCLRLEDGKIGAIAPSGRPGGGVGAAKPLPAEEQPLEASHAVAG
ncbi:cyclic peptide export ABC transporter [Methylogaea oryzae]|uniref:ABC transporter ATP-binding protein n=1 Tax=Methylogaea oryzae TaxID=1295382 RepID=A0A8D5AH65_9GAMM|nr:cyclic peptide export ABC transporter [Methylogaea oryzae]BBL71143.1 ABC transporter ATP-binding protein [Methylogaea oryzae]